MGHSILFTCGSEEFSLYKFIESKTGTPFAPFEFTIKNIKQQKDESHREKIENFITSHTLSTEAYEKQKEWVESIVETIDAKKALSNALYLLQERKSSSEEGQFSMLT